MEKILLLGSGGHAKSVVDAIEQSGKYEIAGFLEVAEKQCFTYKNYHVIGTDDDMHMFYQQGIHYAFVTVGYMGDNTIRESLYKKLKEAQFCLPVIKDSSAVVASDAKLGAGVFIGKHAIINADVKVGTMCIINSAAVVEHDCQIGDYSHIAVGAVLCGAVSIKERVLIGANATLTQGVTIQEQAIIGAGSVVICDIPSYVSVVGNPAKIIRHL